MTASYLPHRKLCLFCHASPRGSLLPVWRRGSAGGVLLTSQEGKITCDNTLDRLVCPASSVALFSSHLRVLQPVGVGIS